MNHYKPLAFFIAELLGIFEITFSQFLATILDKKISEKEAQKSIFIPNFFNIKHKLDRQSFQRLILPYPLINRSLLFLVHNKCKFINMIKLHHHIH